MNESRLVMHRVLVIVLDNEAKADKGKNELLRLDGEGSISIYRYEVLVKKADGTVVIRQAEGHGTLTPFAKSLLGSLTDSTRSTPEPAPTRAGNPLDSNMTETGEDFIRDVMQVLLPNRVAIVAEIEEEWPTVLDRRMQSIGGVVFRWTVSEVQHAVDM
jgi:uncharacterized membrane protein